MWTMSIVLFCPLSVSGLSLERDGRGEVDDEQKRRVVPHVVDAHPYAVQRTLNTVWHGTSINTHSSNESTEQTRWRLTAASFKDNILCAVAVCLCNYHSSTIY
jgi:UDP-N-acetylmuramyl tripeptide synthase